MNEVAHDHTAWICTVVICIGKLTFSHYEAIFSVSYEVNERKKLFPHALDRLMILIMSSLIDVIFKVTRLRG